MGLLRRCRSWVSWKWLWLSHVYPVYWAHKPLCERFRRDVVRLGRVHICRSCLLVYAGLAVGILLWAAFRETVSGYALSAFVTLAGVTMALSFPVWYRMWPRPVRDLLRASLGATAALGGCLLISGRLLPGLIGMVVLGLAWKVYRAVRGRYHLDTCSACPDFEENQVCPGFALEAQCIRMYEERATERLLDQGHVPNVARSGVRS